MEVNWHLKDFLIKRENEMKIIIEVDTNEDEEVLELIRRLIALLEKEGE